MSRPIARLFLGGLIALIVLVKLGCVVIKSESSQPAKFKATRAVSAPAGRAIEAQTVSGSVAVHRGEGADTSITANIAATTQQRLDATKVLAETRPDGSLFV